MPRPPLLVLLLAALNLLAQTRDADPVVNVRFRALSLDGAILGVGYLEGQNFKRLDISGDALTAEQSYVGPNPLQFVEPKGATATAERQLATQTQRDIRLRLRALAEELEKHQAQPMKAKNGSEGGGGRRLASSSQPKGGGGRTDEILREMEVLNQRLDLIESDLNRATIPTLAAPESAGKPKAVEKNQAKKPPPTQSFASFAFPGDGRYLLLIHRTATCTTINALDDREGAFPYGSMQFLNLTGVDVEVRFGANTLALPTRAKGLLRPTAGPNTYLAGEIHTKGKDGYKLGYSMRIFQQDDVRTLYFLLPVEDGGHGVRLKGIEERRADEPVPPVIGGAGEKPATPAR